MSDLKAGHSDGPPRGCPVKSQKKFLAIFCEPDLMPDEFIDIDDKQKPFFFRYSNED